MATDDEVEKKKTDESEDEAEKAESTDESRPSLSEEASESDAETAESKDESDADESETDEPKAKSKKTKGSRKIVVSEKGDDQSPALEDARDEMPTQLGHTRFVYAAYMAVGIAIAFVSYKFIDYTWYKLHDWKPDSLPEAQDELSVVIALVLAVSVTLYYWRQARTRILVEEVAEELTKVTWPSRQDVTSSTTVVIITTLLATVYFALMDQFWLWVTKHVYGS